jgi:hypothetical protein
MPSRTRPIRWISASISTYSGERKTRVAERPCTEAASSPSRRSAALLMVVTRPSGSRETTPVATASSTVSV